MATKFKRPSQKKPGAANVPGPQIGFTFETFGEVTIYDVLMSFSGPNGQPVIQQCQGIFPSAPPSPGSIYAHRAVEIRGTSDLSLGFCDVHEGPGHVKDNLPDLGVLCENWAPYKYKIILYFLQGHEVELDLEGSAQYLEWFEEVTAERLIEPVRAIIQ